MTWDLNRSNTLPYILCFSLILLSVLETTGTTTTTSVTTSTVQTCPLNGDFPPCGEVTLAETLSAINKWSTGEMDINDALALINLYNSSGASYSFSGTFRGTDSNYSNGAAGWIISKAIPTGSGVKWAINDNGTITYDLDLYSGTSGAGYFLLDAYLVTGNTEYLEYSKKAAREVRSRLSENTQIGFFDGRAGIGYFFASLYEATQEKEFLDDAEYVASQITSCSSSDQDMISGAAGIALFYHKLYRITGKAAYLTAGKGCGDYLISKAVSENGGYKWIWPDGSGWVYTGYAHGVAGIVYSLADIYQLSGDSKYLDYARGGAKWLKDEAIADGNGYKWWRRSPDQMNQYQDAWCHGPAGIGLAFLKLYNITSDSSYLDYAKKGGNWIVNIGDLSGYYGIACFCHGSSSLGTYFVDLYKSTNDATNLDYSKEAAEYSKFIATKTSKGYNWTSGCELTDDPTYNCGTGGIGDFFLYTQTRGKIGRLGDFDRKTPWAPIVACLPKTIDTQISPIFIDDGGPWPEYTSSQLGLQVAEKNGVKMFYKPGKKTLAEQLANVSYKGLQLEYQLANISLFPSGFVFVSSFSDLPGVSSMGYIRVDGVSSYVLPTSRKSLPLTLYNDSASWNNMTTYLFYGLEFHEAVDIGLKHDLLGGNLGDLSNRWFVEGQSDYLMFLASQAYGDADAVRSLIPYSLEKLVKLRQTQTTLDVIDENCWWTPSGDRKDTESACYESSAYVFSYLAEKYGSDITRKINNRLRAYQPSQIKSDLICSVIKDITGEDITPLLRAVPLDDVIEYCDKGKLTNNCGTSTTTTTTSTKPSTTTTSTTTSTKPTTTTTTTTKPPTTSTTTSTTSIPTTTQPYCPSSSSQTLASGDNSIDFQTPHNYPNNLDCYSGVYNCPGGYSAKVYAKYDTEKDFDYFYVYNYNTGSSLALSGNSSGYAWLATNANTIRFRFTSDQTVTAWGVGVDKINCYLSTTTTSTTTSTSSTTSLTTTSTTASTTSTTVAGPCKMPGNDPPCDEVTLTEVVSAMNKWAEGNITLGDLIGLIYSWIDPQKYPPQ